MRRRRFIVGTIALSGVLAGCLSSDSSADSDDQSTTQTPDSSQPTQLNVLPVKQSTPVSDGGFTETDRSSPLEANAFIGVYEEILQSKDLQIEWTSNVRGETVEVLYPADDTNHEQRMSVFVDAFIELTRQTGGAGRDMRFVVKTSGSAWYEWELPDDLAREYLHGEISYGELFETINETIETIEEPRGPPSGTEPESDADLTPEEDDDADRDEDDDDRDEDGDDRDDDDKPDR